MFNRHALRLLTIISIFFTTLQAHSAVFDNAEPINENTNIIKVFDGFNDQPFYLLLTNETGYKIQCTETNTLFNMLQGFGLDAGAASAVLQFSIDDPTVINSHYEDNPSLNCELGDEDLHVVEYPNGESKYFIGFDNNTSLNMVGCQGLLDVMGFDINQAEPIPYALAQQYFDISDDRDIHCIDGLAPGACGEHENNSVWNANINNGQQSYRCDNTIEVINGAPICNFNYEAVGSACVAKSCGDQAHNSYWNDSIPNGTQNYTCDFGVTSPLGAPICNSTHEADSAGPGGNCMPKNCGANLHDETWNETISNGSQTYQCNFGEVIANGAPTCNSDSMVVGNTCVKKNCGIYSHGDFWNVAIPNGQQSYFCNAGIEESFGSLSCNDRYQNQGNSCVYVPLNCDGGRLHGENWNLNIFSGSQTRTCNDGTIEINETLCDSDHILSNANQCVIKQSFATGEWHTCAIQADMTLACWGVAPDDKGQSTIPAGIGAVLSVAAGDHHTCAIKSDQTLACWGISDGSLHDLDQINIPNNLGPVLAVAVKYDHTCVIKSDETVECWGANELGQSDAPNNLGKVLALSTGARHACAIKNDKTVACWGQGVDFEIFGDWGIPTVPSNLGKVLAISAGDFHTCAIKENNSLICWGSDIFGQSIVPGNLGSISSINAYDHDTCAINANQNMVCWGADTQSTTNPIPNGIPNNLNSLIDLEGDANHLCAIDSSRSLMCWNFYRMFGYDGGQSLVPLNFGPVL